MAALPPIGYQQLAQPLLANVAAAGDAAGAIVGGGVAPAPATAAHYGGDHMDIERVESSMKKFLSENCVDTNATVLQNIRTFWIMYLTYSRTKAHPTSCDGYCCNRCAFGRERDTYCGETHFEPQVAPVVIPPDGILPNASDKASMAHSATRPSSQDPASALRFNYYHYPSRCYDCA